MKEISREERIKNKLEDATGDLPRNFDMWTAIHARLVTENIEQIEPKIVPNRQARRLVWASMGLTVLLIFALFTAVVLFNPPNSALVVGSANLTTTPVPIVPTIPVGTGATPNNNEWTRSIVIPYTTAEPAGQYINSRLVKGTGDRPVRALAFSPDGKKVAWGTEDKEVNVICAEMKCINGKPSFFSGHTASVLSLAWSPDSKLLASASVDGTVFIIPVDEVRRVWTNPDGSVALTQLGNGKETTIKGILGITLKLEWSPDGEILAIANANRVYLWHKSSGKQTVVETQSVDIAWSPDGKVLAAGGGSKLNFIDRQGTIINSVDTDGWGKAYSLAWSPDGKYIAAGSLDVRLWQADGTPVWHTLNGTSDANIGGWIWRNNGAGKPVQTSPFVPVASLVWSPDSSRFATASAGGAIQFWKVDGTLEFTWRIEAKSNSSDPLTTRPLAWSPNGKRLAFANRATPVSHNFANKTDLYFANQHNNITVLAWSPDSKTLVTGNTLGEIYLLQADAWAGE
jgi:WD40 repeat protein